MAQNLTTIQILPSAARTASPGPVQPRPNKFNRGVQLIVDVTAIAATPSITVSIQGKDQATGIWYSLLTSAAITTVSTNILRVEPAATPVANTVADAGMPRIWRVNVVLGDADSITYSVSANLLV